METLLKILAELRPDVDFEENKELVDSGELDSFDIVSLVGELCDEYDIEIGADEIVPENFLSLTFSSSPERFCRPAKSPMLHTFLTQKGYPPAPKAEILQPHLSL